MGANKRGNDKRKNIISMELFHWQKEWRMPIKVVMGFIHMKL